MTSAYVASVVRTVLSERGLAGTGFTVAALPFSWEVTLNTSSGAHQRFLVPDGAMQMVADAVRWAFAFSDDSHGGLLQASVPPSR
jgi:hypothetical protein